MSELHLPNLSSMQTSLIPSFLPMNQVSWNTGNHKNHGSLRSMYQGYGNSRVQQICTNLKRCVHIVLGSPICWRKADQKRADLFDLFAGLFPIRRSFNVWSTNSNLQLPYWKDDTKVWRIFECHPRNAASWDNDSQNGRYGVWSSIGYWTWSGERRRRPEGSDNYECGVGWERQFCAVSYVIRNQRCILLLPYDVFIFLTNFLVVNTVTNRVVRLLGKDENCRWLNLSLYQGAPAKTGFKTAVRLMFPSSGLTNRPIIGYGCLSESYFSWERRERSYSVLYSVQATAFLHVHPHGTRVCYFSSLRDYVLKEFKGHERSRWPRCL